MPSGTRRVVLLRGHVLRASDLVPWAALGDGYDVVVPTLPGDEEVVRAAGLQPVPARSARSRLPRGRAGDLATRALGDRYLGVERLLRDADIVHAAELGFWFSVQAARLRERLGFRLVLTAWETLPFLDAYRNVRTRRYRREVLAATDLFLAATERAREALLLEGAAAERISICPPGVDVERFAAARDGAADVHTVLSIGRLVWEKGHQDVLRAVARLRARGRRDVRVVIAGTGPEERRLRATASDLGVDVEFTGHLPYERVPDLFARASCLILASLPTWYWEEQFGMVLVEAMAAHVPVIASSSGAIPEVVGESGTLFAPGDWVGLADALERGPLAEPAPARRAPDPARLERFSQRSAAACLRAAYDRVQA